MIDSATFNNLKARVKAECARRKYTGSVESYAGTAYDYTNPAAAGKLIRYEHYTKLAEPLTAIDGKTRMPRTRINQADITEMQNVLTTLEGKSLTTTSTGCSASCTGLCYTACSGGCKGNCSAVCQNDCNYDCYGTCYAVCADSCAGQCGDHCGGTCGTSCSDTCTGGCRAACADGGCYGSIMY